MSDINRDQFNALCAPLARAWKDIRMNGDVYGLGETTWRNTPCTQINWALFRELFPKNLNEIFVRSKGHGTYPYEARALVKGVLVICLLTASEMRLHETESDTAIVFVPDNPMAEPNYEEAE